MLELLRGATSTDGDGALRILFNISEAPRRVPLLLNQHRALLFSSESSRYAGEARRGGSIGRVGNSDAFRVRGGRPRRLDRIHYQSNISKGATWQCLTEKWRSSPEAPAESERAPPCDSRKKGAMIGLADMAGQEAEAKEVVSEIERAGSKAIFLPCDVSEPAEVERAIDEITKTFGRLDVVFANAGINGVWTPIEELQPEEWDQTLDINLKGTFLTVHYAIPHLRKAGGGSVIVCSSVNGNRTFSNAGAAPTARARPGRSRS